MCEHVPGKVRLPQFRFGTRTLLVLTTLVAIFCSAILAAPPWAVGVDIWVLSLAYPMALVIGATQARGYLRAFCIGGLLPAIACIPVLAFVWWNEDFFRESFGLHECLLCALWGLFPLAAIVSWGGGGMFAYWLWLFASPTEVRHLTDAGPDGDEGNTDVSA